MDQAISAFRKQVVAEKITEKPGRICSKRLRMALQTEVSSQLLVVLEVLELNDVPVEHLTHRSKNYHLQARKDKFWP